MCSGPPISCKNRCLSRTALRRPGRSRRNWNSHAIPLIKNAVLRRGKPVFLPGDLKGILHQHAVNFLRNHKVARRIRVDAVREQVFLVAHERPKVYQGNAFVKRHGLDFRQDFIVYDHAVNEGRGAEGGEGIARPYLRVRGKIGKGIHHCLVVWDEFVVIRGPVVKLLLKTSSRWCPVR